MQSSLFYQREVSDKCAHLGDVFNVTYKILACGFIFIDDGSTFSSTVIDNDVDLVTVKRCPFL